MRQLAQEEKEEDEEAQVSQVEEKNAIAQVEAEEELVGVVSWGGSGQLGVNRWHEFIGTNALTLLCIFREQSQTLKLAEIRGVPKSGGWY